MMIRVSGVVVVVLVDGEEGGRVLMLLFSSRMSRCGKSDGMVRSVSDNTEEVGVTFDFIESVSEDE